MVKIKTMGALAEMVELADAEIVKRDAASITNKEA